MFLLNEIFLRNVILSFAIYWLYLLDNGSLELNRRVVLISLERPHVTDVNLQIARLLNVTSRRHGRSDPIHYVHLWLQYLRPLEDISEVAITVHEFMSNEYRPSFVELRFSFCDFIYNFLKLGHIYYKSNESTPLTPCDLKHCYLKSGIYYIANISLPISSLPENFPFEKGRVFLNHTYKRALVMAGFVDMELKTLPVRKYKSRL